MFRLNDFLPYRLYRLSEAAGDGFQTIYKNRAGLTRPQWRVLATLGENGQMTATQLGQHTAMHKTKISRAIGDLERRRWIVRARRKSDKRFEDVALSRAGKRAYHDLADQAQAYDVKILRLATTEECADIEKGLQTLEKLMTRV